MNRNKKLAFFATVIVFASTVAYASPDGRENDAMATGLSKVSMLQAITAAEKHTNGKASRAEYEHSKQGRVYDVEVVSSNKVFDVKVDAEKGTVIESAEDKADYDKED